MSKYKKGDKVVIRKDLVDFKEYRGIMWTLEMSHMQKGYVEIEEVDFHGDYRVGDWFISDLMIQGLYQDK